MTDPVLRPGTVADAAALAALHRTQIPTGFLPLLGDAFLRRLYRRAVLADDLAFVVVATTGPGGAPGGRVVGFAAAACDLAAFHRRFVRHDGAAAALAALPVVVRHLPRVLETARAAGGAADDGVAAEVMAVAVDPDQRGRGVGRRLVAATTAELARRGVAAARVVAGADNVPALRLYASCGFRPGPRIEVHAGTPSQTLLWP